MTNYILVYIVCGVLVCWWFTARESKRGYPSSFIKILLRGIFWPVGIAVWFEEWVNKDTMYINITLVRDQEVDDQ